MAAHAEAAHHGPPPAHHSSAKHGGMHRATNAAQQPKTPGAQVGNQAQARNAGENRMHWRSLILTGVLPALVALIGVIVTIALSHGGLG